MSFATIPDLEAEYNRKYGPVEEVPAVYVIYQGTNACPTVYGTAPPFRNRRCLACGQGVTFAKRWFGSGHNGGYVECPAVPHMCMGKKL